MRIFRNRCLSADVIDMQLCKVSVVDQYDIVERVTLRRRRLRLCLVCSLLASILIIAALPLFSLVQLNAASAVLSRSVIRMCPANHEETISLASSWQWQTDPTNQASKWLRSTTLAGTGYQTEFAINQTSAFWWETVLTGVCQHHRLVVWEAELLGRDQAEPNGLPSDSISLLVSIIPTRDAHEQHIIAIDGAFLEMNQTHVDAVSSDLTCLLHVSIGLSLRVEARVLIVQFGRDDQRYGIFLRCLLSPLLYTALINDETSKDLDAVTISSENVGLMMSIPLCRLRGHVHDVAVCSPVLFGSPAPTTPRMIFDWLHYYLYIGVQHVYAYDRYGSLYSSLNVFRQRGLLNYQRIPRLFSIGTYYDQLVVFHMCIMQARQLSRYVLYVDVDEYWMNYHPTMSSDSAWSAPSPSCHQHPYTHCSSYLQRYLSLLSKSSIGLMIAPSVPFIHTNMTRRFDVCKDDMNRSMEDHVVHQYVHRTRSRDLREKMLFRPVGAYDMWIHDGRHRDGVLRGDTVYGNEVGITALHNQSREQLVGDVLSKSAMDAHQSKYGNSITNVSVIHAAIRIQHYFNVYGKPTSEIVDRVRALIHLPNEVDSGQLIVDNILAKSIGSDNGRLAQWIRKQTHYEEYAAIVKAQEC